MSRRFEKLAVVAGANSSQPGGGGRAGGLTRGNRLFVATGGLIAVFALILLGHRVSWTPEVVVTGPANARQATSAKRNDDPLLNVQQAKPRPLVVVKRPTQGAEGNDENGAKEPLAPPHGDSSQNDGHSGSAANEKAKAAQGGASSDSAGDQEAQANFRPSLDMLSFPNSGSSRPIRIRKSAARRNHIAAAAAGALSDKPLKLHHDWKNPPLDSVTGPNIRTLPTNGSYVCELFLFGMPHVCRIEQGDESMLDCIKRVGGRVLELALPTRCTKTPYWKSVRELGPATGTTGRDWVYMAQVAPDAKPVPYVPPSERVFRRDIESKQCSYGTLHPITFAIPYRNIVPAVTRHKFYDFLPYGLRKFPPWVFRPGDYRMGHQDEFLTSLLHKHSYFAFTHKRGGWDCMRHTEILAAGSIPYFADLHLCGKYCLVMLPKDMLKEAFDMAGVSYIGAINGKVGPNHEFIEAVPYATANMNFKKPGRIDWNSFDSNKYYELADRILNYTQNYMSTRSLVSYVLHKIGYEEPKHVFVLGRDHMDYLELMMESGFADLGINYTANHVRPTWHQVVEADGKQYTTDELERIRTSRGLKSEMHGASMVVGMRIPPLQESTDHDEIRRKLADGFFDLVVYTWPHWPCQQYPFWNEVSKAVPRERIVFIDGGDDGNDPHNDFRGAIRHGHIFRRELHEGQC